MKGSGVLKHKLPKYAVYPLPSIRVLVLVLIAGFFFGGICLELEAGYRVPKSLVYINTYTDIYTFHANLIPKQKQC